MSANHREVMIVGCGWLGLQLGRELVQSKFPVLGTTTRAERLETLKDAGITPLLVKLPAPLSKKCAKVIYTVPPGSGRPVSQVFTAIESVLDTQPEHFIYISSTSVYGAAQGAVDETSPTLASSETGKVLSEIETLLAKWANEKAAAVTIVRPGGLLGWDRHPARFLSGRKNLDGGDDPVNLVHGEDLVRALVALTTASAPDRGEIQFYNVVSSAHPSRRDFYTEACRLLQIEIPEFAETSQITSTKTVRSDKIRKIPTMKFKYDDLGKATESVATFSITR